MFAEMFESDSFCRYRILSKNHIVATTIFNIPSALQMTWQHVVELVISKTTYNRNERTPTTIHKICVSIYPYLLYEFVHSPCLSL